jgi:hypothetical protein
MGRDRANDCADRPQFERNERTIVSAAYYGGVMLDGLRHELQEARAIQFAAILNRTLRLTMPRAAGGGKSDPDDAPRG